MSSCSSEEEKDDEMNVPEGEYIVEKILDIKWDDCDDCVKFLIKWEGYDDPSDNTWEPEKNLKCPDLVKEWRGRISDLRTEADLKKGVERKSTGEGDSSSSEDEVEVVQKELKKKSEEVTIPKYKDDLEDFDPLASNSDEEPKKKKKRGKQASKSRKPRMVPSSSSDSTDSDDPWGEERKEKLERKKEKLERKKRETEEKMLAEKRKKELNPTLSEESSDADEETAVVKPRPGPRSKTKDIPVAPKTDVLPHVSKPRPGPRSKTKDIPVTPTVPSGGDAKNETPRPRPGPKSKTRIIPVIESTSCDSTEAPKPRPGPKSKTKVFVETEPGRNVGPVSGKIDMKRRAGPKSRTRDLTPVRSPYFNEPRSDTKSKSMAASLLAIDVPSDTKSKSKSMAASLLGIDVASSDDDDQTLDESNPSEASKSNESRQKSMKTLEMFGLEAASSDDGEDDEDTNQSSLSASVPAIITPTKKSQSFRIKYYEDPEKYVPERIVGIAHINGILLFHLQYKSKCQEPKCQESKYQESKCQEPKHQESKCQGSKSEVVPSEILRYDHPEIVIQFYEHRARMYQNHIFRSLVSGEE